MSENDELDSNVSVTQLPSHGGYMSGMPMYAGDKEVSRSKRNKCSGKRSSKVEIDDSEQESDITPPKNGPINLSKVSRSSQKHVRTSPRLQ